MGFTNLNFGMMVGVFALVAAAVYGLEMAAGGTGGSLLFCMLFFVMLAQGPLAVIAATDIVKSDWAVPYKREMLSVHHLSLFIGLLFIAFFLVSDLDFYNWTRRDHPIPWLNKTFLLARNVAVLVIAWLVGSKFAKESLNNMVNPLCNAQLEPRTNANNLLSGGHSSLITAEYAGVFR